MVAMAQLIDAAAASQPDGIAISIPDADALGDSIQAGVDAGIPMVSLDSGSDVAADLGMLTHVGQTEYEAGFAAGQRMGEAGSRPPFASTRKSATSPSRIAAAASPTAWLSRVARSRCS